MKRAKALVLGFFESRNYSQAYESCGTKWIELATVDADVHHRIAKGGMPKNQEVDFSKRLYEVSANFGPRGSGKISQPASSGQPFYGVGFGDLGERLHDRLRVLGVHTFSKISADGFWTVEEARRFVVAGTESTKVEDRHFLRIEFRFVHLIFLSERKGSLLPA